MQIFQYWIKFDVQNMTIVDIENKDSQCIDTNYRNNIEQ